MKDNSDAPLKKLLMKIKVNRIISMIECLEGKSFDNRIGSLLITLKEFDLIMLKKILDDKLQIYINDHESNKLDDIRYYRYMINANKTKQYIDKLLNINSIDANSGGLVRRKKVKE